MTRRQAAGGLWLVGVAAWCGACVTSQAWLAPSRAPRDGGSAHALARSVVRLVPYTHSGSPVPQCLGVLVSGPDGASLWVASARHCFERRPVPQGVVLGWEASKTPRVLRLSASAICPAGRDVVLLRLEGAAGDEVWARPLASRRPEIGTEVVSAVYDGARDDGLGGLHLDTKVLRSPAACEPMQKQRRQATTPRPKDSVAELCVAPGPRLPRHGDSGGPLFVKEDREWRVAGIAVASWPREASASLFEPLVHEDFAGHTTSCPTVLRNARQESAPAPPHGR